MWPDLQEEEISCLEEASGQAAGRTERGLASAGRGLAWPPTDYGVPWRDLSDFQSVTQREIPERLGNSQGCVSGEEEPEVPWWSCLMEWVVGNCPVAFDFSIVSAKPFWCGG